MLYSSPQEIMLNCKQVKCTHATFEPRRRLKVPNFFGTLSLQGAKKLGKIPFPVQQRSLLQVGPGYLLTFLCLCMTNSADQEKLCCDSRAAGWKGRPSRITHTEPNTLSPLELQTNWFYSTGHLTICKTPTHLHCWREEKMLLTKSLWCSQPTNNKQEALNF